MSCRNGVAVCCLAIRLIFDETDHKLIIATQTDDGGHFELKDILDGDHRLVAKYEGLSLANAKIRIERRSRSRKPLAVQMRPAGSIQVVSSNSCWGSRLL